MKVFSIEIQEKLLRIVEVEAESKMEAIQKIKSMYFGEEIVLDYSDHIETNVISIGGDSEIIKERLI